VEAEAAVHGAAAEEVPVAEVPAGAGKSSGSDRETGLFFMYGSCVGPTMENLSAHLFSVVKR
jgi:hypothetical protein